VGRRRVVPVRGLWDVAGREREGRRRRPAHVEGLDSPAIVILTVLEVVAGGPEHRVEDALAVAGEAARCSVGLSGDGGGGGPLPRRPQGSKARGAVAVVDQGEEGPGEPGGEGHGEDREGGLLRRGPRGLAHTSCIETLVLLLKAVLGGQDMRRALVI